LDFIIQAYVKRGTRNRAMMEALFIAGDVNQDGILSMEEFRSMVLQVQPDVPAPMVAPRQCTARDCGEAHVARLYHSFGKCSSKPIARVPR